MYILERHLPCDPVSFITPCPSLLAESPSIVIIIAHLFFLLYQSRTFFNKKERSLQVVTIDANKKERK